MPDPIDPRSIARIVVRPLGSPMPLGFFAFGTGLALSAAFELGIVPASEGRHLALAMLSFAAPLEALACVLAFFSRDTMGATIMGLFSCSWLVSGVVTLGLAPGALSPLLGCFEAVLAAAVLVLAVIAIPSKPFFAWLLFLATCRFGLAAAHELGATHVVPTVSAFVALAVVLLAFYGAAALLLEDIHQETVLPLFRRKGARRSIEGGLSEQLERLSNEPGVRSQL